MNNLNYISTIVAILAHLSVTLVECDHFRGAIMSWSPNGSGGITINYRISWRLASGNAYCDDNVMNSGQVTYRYRDYLFCTSGCNEAVGYLHYQCTGYSPESEDDWSSGLGSITYTPPSGVTQLSIGFTDCCWVQLYGNPAGWSMVVNVDLSVRADTGQINNSPTVDLLPLVSLQYGCDFTLQLPVNDVDGDTVRCRWAATETECGDACGLAPVLTLDTDACTLTYDPVAAASYPATLYIVALQIEDFATASSNTPLSSIPVQFLLSVFENPAPCGSGPEFIAPTPESCVIAKPGESMTLTIKARSKTSLKAITTTSALGMQRSPIVFTSDDTWNYITLDILWIPSPSDMGSKRVVCFYASDIDRLTSETRCVYVLVAECEAQAPANGDFIETITSRCDYKGRYTCDPEYELIGTSEVTCDASGQWSSPPAVCKLIDCGALAAPENGKVFQPLTTKGAYTLFMCDPGYTVVGERSPRCEATSTWSHSPPTCELIDCGELNAPMNGSVSFSSTLLGSATVVSCDEGFDLNGDETVTCQENGCWSSTIHPCFSHSCVIKDCGPPQPPINGHVVYELTTYGAVATFECDRSYEMTGQDAIECLSSGSWNATAPVCARGGSSEESLEESLKEASEELLGDSLEESLGKDSDESSEESLE